MVQALSPFFAIPISATTLSNEPILSVKENSSTIDIDSDFVKPTQDSSPEDESCSGLAEIQICAVDFFSINLMNSNIRPSMQTDTRIFDYIDLNESPDDNPDYNPLVVNPDPSFDWDKATPPELYYSSSASIYTIQS